MKINFKKVVSVLATTAMLGSTVAFAAAAYPAPFVQSGAADAAIIVGSMADASDMAAATDLRDNLNTGVTSSGTTAISGTGDSYLLEKSSTKLHIGSGLLDVVSASVTEDKLPTLLASGKYLDSDNNEYDFEQKITLANATVNQFDDNNYLDQNNNPTVGIMYNSGDQVLNYTLTMTDPAPINKLETTDLTLLGKTYYVLDATNTTLTLLDSAERVSLGETDTKTVSVNGKDYAVSVNFIGTSGSNNVVKLTVNGQTTNSLQTGQTYKLSDGAYVGIRDISIQNYAGGAKNVEFGLGKGKLLITTAQEVQINDNAISRLKGFITNNSAGSLTTVALEWKADGKKFVAPSSDLVMPGFEAVKLTWGGLTSAAEEKVLIQKGGDAYMQLKDFPLKDGPATIDILYSADNGNLTAPGKDANNLLRTSNSTAITFDADTDAYFVASYHTATEAESYLLKASNFVKNGNYNETDISKYADGAWSKVKTVKDDAASTVDIGSLTLTVGAIDRDQRTVVLTNSGDKFNIAYTKAGMKVQLPWTTTGQILNTTSTTNSTSCSALTWAVGQIGTITVKNGTGSSATCGTTSSIIYYNETDKDGSVALGRAGSATIGFNSATTPQTTVSAVASDSGMKEIGTSKIYNGFLYSETATGLSWDKSGDQYAVTLTNHVGETAAKVYLTAPSVTAADSAKIQVYKDTEASSVQNKNLIVVGGSCINTLAATMLGSATPLCGAEFSAKTTVGAGQYLIQVAASPLNTQKIAMLVAGYNAVDTSNAVKAVKGGSIDTTTGTKVVGPVNTAP
jgi:hypothetical protein